MFTFFKVFFCNLFLHEVPLYLLQDFEDWDDVGLNIPKPAELLQLYRDYMRQTGHLKPPGTNIGCQTDHLPEQSDESIDVTDMGKSNSQTLESSEDCNLIEKLVRKSDACSLILL